MVGYGVTTASKLFGCPMYGYVRTLPFLRGRRGLRTALSSALRSSTNGAHHVVIAGISVVRRHILARLFMCGPIFGKIFVQKQLLWDTSDLHLWVVPSALRGRLLTLVATSTVAPARQDDVEGRRKELPLR